MPRIFFAGLGAMGSKMARNILNEPSNELIVWNRSKSVSVK